MLYTLFDCNNLDEVLTKGYGNALLLVTGAIDRIMIGGDDITQEDLVISKLLGQNIEKRKHDQIDRSFYDTQSIKGRRG